MKIVIYDTLTKEITSAWKKLWNESKFANFTNSPEWFIAADSTYHYENKKIIAMFSDKNQLIGICGLVQEKIAGLFVWTCAAREFADKQPLLIDYTKKKETDCFIDALESLGFVYLINVKKEHTDMFVDNHPSSVLHLDFNSYIDFSEGPFGNFKQTKVNHLLRKLQKEGHTLQKEANISDKKKALQTAFAIEENSSKRQNGKAVFDNPIARNFYMNLLTYAPELVNVTIIKIDEKPVAYSIDFINKNSTQGSQKAHIPVYNRYSPARFLIMALCERAKTNGESFFDFGRGIDDFKRSFITRSEETYGVFICQNIIRRNYLRNVFMIRNTVYDLLVQSKPLYRLYRWILKGVRHG